MQSRLRICFGLPLCVVLFACIRLAHAQTVTGKVLYQDGTPVHGAKVKFFTYAPTASILPETDTADNGTFSLHIANFGNGAVTASKVGEGFPDALDALYGRSGSRSFKEIASDANNSGPIVLQFGSPHQVLLLSAYKEASGRSLPDARVLLQAIANPHIKSSLTLPSDGELTLVLPFQPISVRIVARESQTETFTVQSSGPAPGQRVGEKLKRKVLLRRASENAFQSRSAGAGSIALRASH